MKRILIYFMLLAAMLTGMIRVYAAEAEMAVQVRASKTEVQVGDTVEYTVLATGNGVVAMQFNVIIPEGLSYVPNSGRTPDKLAQKLGVPAADWTEQSMMFTFYNDIGITFAKGTEILRFSCVAEKEGTWAPELYELLPFNGEFEEFQPKLQIQSIKVTGDSAPIVPGETQPPTTGETSPAVSNPEQPTTQQQPEQTEPIAPDVTQSVTEPEDTEDEMQEPQESKPDTEIQQDQSVEEQKPTPNPGRNWKAITILSVGVILLVSGSAALWAKARRSKKSED